MGSGASEILGPLSMGLVDIERGIKDLNSGWLGTDPLRNDSMIIIGLVHNF